MGLLRIVITENAFSNDPNVQEIALSISYKDLKTFIETANVNRLDIIILNTQEE